MLKKSDLEKEDLSKYGLRHIHANVTLKAESGKSIHDPKAELSLETINQYLPKKGNLRKAEKILKKMGFQIVTKSKITIAIVAPIEMFEKILNLELEFKRFFPYMLPKVQRVPDEKGCGMEVFYKGRKRIPVPGELKDIVESIHLSFPAMFCQDSNPPNLDYFHLKVPNDIARIVDATQCHRKGIKGRCTSLAMPDQGTFDHPYYTSRGYNIILDESAYDDTTDDGSHGTAIAANALAVAPKVKFIGVRNGKKLSSAFAAFQKSAEHNPNVISISWGILESTYNNSLDDDGITAADLRAAILLAINDGITVFCACGNGGMLAFPSSMPEVVSVGGTYANNKDELEASTYASSGALATIDIGRHMPDLTGYVGQNPKGIYITLPCHPSSSEDDSFGGSSFPDYDETTKSDGWLVASGTSSATPQAAAVACLLIQSNRSKYKGKPSLIKERLMESCIDVKTGSSANGENAAIGIDDATGTGVIDAFIAINGVDLWIKDNPQDTGLIPSRRPYCISPDIKILDAPLDNPETEFDGASSIFFFTPGKKYYAYVKVRNRGIEPASQVSVRLFYSNPGFYNYYPFEWRSGRCFDFSGKIVVNHRRTNLFKIRTIPAKDSRIAGPFEWTRYNLTEYNSVGEGIIGRKIITSCFLAITSNNADPYRSRFTTPIRSQWFNNAAVKNYWLINPYVTYPITIRGFRELRDNTIIINTENLPRDYVFGLVIPSDTTYFDKPFPVKPFDMKLSTKDKIFLFPAGKKYTFFPKTKKRLPAKFFISQKTELKPLKSFQVSGAKTEIDKPSIHLIHKYKDNVLGDIYIKLDTKKTENKSNFIKYLKKNIG